MVSYLKENGTNHISFIRAQNKMLNLIMTSRTTPVLELAALEFAVSRGLDIYESLTKALVPINIVDIKLFSVIMLKP